MRRRTLAVLWLGGVVAAASAGAQPAGVETPPEAEAPAEAAPAVAPEPAQAGAESEVAAPAEGTPAPAAETASEGVAATEPEPATESESSSESEGDPDDEEEADDADDAEEAGEGDTEGRDPPHGGIGLPGDLRLNGVFDLAYERVGYSDELGDGRDALRNYHHFLFLRREARDDPFGISVELVDLTFYEIGIRLTESSSPWRISAKLGKILVPFGDEPLFHHTYGGASGFDQRFVPFIWARHGASLRVQHNVGDVSLQNDTYVVQGHVISEPDQVIDLQTDLSADDDARFAFGDRVGVSWDAITAWYSIYYNRLRFDRQLLLQAIDVSLWRLRDVPVLENIVLTVGVARADVSGGGWTEDRVPLEHYYHFADYVQLQYYLTEWLQLEGRAGLVTTNNREGVLRDDARDDVTDVSTYALGLKAQYGGLSASLHHTWRLEAVDEQPNDFLRLRVGYAF